MNNIGDIYRKQGDFKKAEGIYFKAKDILEKSLGSNHVEVAEVLNSMGLIKKKKEPITMAQKIYMFVQLIL